MKKSALIFLILFLGFALRSYNLTFPTIGYHNMKENESLIIAQEMMDRGDYQTKRVYFYGAFDEREPPRIDFADALVPYQIILSWKVLGENLWGPRLFNVAFGLLSVLIIYYISMILFKEERLALFSALLMAVMPLAVYFSKMLMPESPALFFMLLGSLFYIRYITTFKIYNLLLGAIAFSLVWFYGFNHLIGIIPVIFCIPFKKIYRDRKRIVGSSLVLILPPLLVSIVALYLRRIGFGQRPYWNIGALRPFEIFSPAYWTSNGSVIWQYTAMENFTVVFAAAALFGTIAAFLKRTTLASRYVMGWALALLVYCMIFSGSLYQNNFVQMPFLAAVCIAVTYLVSFISETLRKIIKVNPVIFTMVFVAGLAGPIVYKSLLTVNQTVFIGADVAGESLNGLTKKDERVFLLTHAQGFAVARYAHRYVGWAEDLNAFKRIEKTFNMRYICFYPADSIMSLKSKQPELYEYIEANYYPREIGLTEEPMKLYYLILEKGKGSKLEDFFKSITGSMQLRTIYRVAGKLIFFYSIVPQAS